MVMTVMDTAGVFLNLLIIEFDPCSISLCSKDRYNIAEKSVITIIFDFITRTNIYEGLNKSMCSPMCLTCIISLILCNTPVR